MVVEHSPGLLPAFLVFKTEAPAVHPQPVFVKETLSWIILSKWQVTAGRPAEFRLASPAPKHVLAHVNWLGHRLGAEKANRLG